MEKRGDRPISNDWRDRSPRRRGILIRIWPILCCRRYREILLLAAALAFVVIASCYDVDTFTTTSGERVRLACINSPEPRGERVEPVPDKAARDHLWDLRVGKNFGIRRITEDRYERTVPKLFVRKTNVQHEMVATSHAEVYQRHAHQRSTTCAPTRSTTANGLNRLTFMQPLVPPTTSSPHRWPSVSRRCSNSSSQLNWSDWYRQLLQKTRIQGSFR